MHYLKCPPVHEREMVITNVLGENVTRSEQNQVTGMIAKEPVVAKWWDFIQTACGEDKFFEKLTGFEPFEVGVAFKTLIEEARKQPDIEVIAIEDDLARRLKTTILARAFDRNTQHNYFKWVKLITEMSNKDPRAAASVATTGSN